jgi:HlyD family secretion protein
MISILIVDDQKLVRQGIQMILELKPELLIVGTAQDGFDAIAQVETIQPDVVLMDIEMPGMNGITATREISQQFPDVKVLILSSHDNEYYAAHAIQAGASGYLLKHINAEDLAKAICLVHQGYSQLDSKLLEKVVVGTSNSLSIGLQKEVPALVQKNGLGRKKSLSNNLEIAFEQPHSKEETFLPLSREVANINNSIVTQEIVKPSIQSKLPAPVQESQPNHKLSKPDNQQKSNSHWLPYIYWTVCLGIVSIMILAVGILYFTRSRSTTQDAAVVTPANPNIPVQTTIDALGRLEPQGEVIKVSASSNLGQQSKVDRLLVREGEQVKAGQVIAVLDSRDRAQASLVEAQKQVQVAKSKLAQVEAGAKQGEIEAKKAFIINLEAKLSGNINTYQATIARLTAELENAQSEYQRNQKLFDDGAVSISTLDAKKLTLNTARERWQEAISNLEANTQTLQAQIQEAKATLAQTAEVRPTDVATAQAELDSAIATFKRSQAELNLSYVRAPQTGRILNINTRSGETIGNDGIVELAQSDRMYAVAEVYETDISKIKIGQTATITSDRNTFPGKLIGKVDDIGWQIAKKDVLDTDPTAATDARVVEVKIRLEPNASRQLARLTNMQVNVAIKL